MTSVARIVVDQLAALGADTAFGVPGESYLAVLDALHDDVGLRFVTCRHESGATFAADAHARLTGRPGLAMVTRGPGLTNGSIGIHTAHHDEVPLVVLVGLIPTHQRGRGAFQELDLAGVAAALGADAFTIDEPDTAAQVITEAWTTALSGRPGPVVVGLPEDVLDLETSSDLHIALELSAPVDTAALTAARAAIARAERPVAVVGGSTWDDASISALPDVLVDVPLIAAFRHQDLLDHRRPTTVGVLGLVNDPGLVAAVQDADLVVAIGTRLDDPTTGGFTLLRPDVPLVHVHPSTTEIGRNHPAVIGIEASASAFVGALGMVTPASDRSRWCAAVRSSYEVWAAGGGPQEALARSLGESLPRDTVVTNGAGNFTRPFHRAFPYGRPGRQLAPANGSMGYGLPAAVSAALTRPDSAVLCVAGDGDLLMTGQEMATAAQYGARLTVLVVDNGSYGTIRTHQERRYPGRPFATDLVNPDVAAWARSFGADAWTTDDTDHAAELVTRAVTTRAFALVHLHTLD